MGIIAWLTVLGFALSSSIDNFGVGVSYGVCRHPIHFEIILDNTVDRYCSFVCIIIEVWIIMITLIVKKKSGRDALVKILTTYLDVPKKADRDNHLESRHGLASCQFGGE